MLAHSEINKRIVEEMSQDINIQYFYKGYQIIASDVGLKNKIDREIAIHHKKELNKKVITEHIKTYEHEKENAMNEKVVKSFKLRGNFVDSAKKIIDEVISLDGERKDLEKEVRNYKKNDVECTG